MRFPGPANALMIAPPAFYDFPDGGYTYSGTITRIRFTSPLRIFPRRLTLVLY